MRDQGLFWKPLVMHMIVISKNRLKWQEHSGKDYQVMHSLSERRHERCNVWYSSRQVCECALLTAIMREKEMVSSSPELPVNFARSGVALP